MQEWQQAPIIEDSWQQAPITDDGKNTDIKKLNLETSSVKSNHNLFDEYMHGLSFGLSDEIKAGVTAPFEAYRTRDNLGDAYDRNLQSVRLAQEEYQTNNPVKSAAANIAGGLTTGFGGIGRGLLNRFGPWVGSAITGGVSGGIYGFGDSEGGLKNRAKGAAIGGTVGAFLSPLVPAALMGGKNAVNKISNVLGLSNAEDVTVQRILRAMQDDGLDPKQIGNVLDEWASSGKPMTLADMGANVRSLAAYTAKQPGAGRTFALEKVLARQQGQVDRVIGDIKDFVSSDDLYTKVDDLVDARRIEARPYYEKAYKKEFVWSDKLEDLITRKPVQKALKNAEYLMQAEGKNPKGLGYVFNEAGDVKFIGTPSMEALDYIKRGMDDVVEGYRDKTTGKLVLDGKGRAFNNLLREYKDELVKLNPEYGKALNAFAGPSHSIDIIQRGQSFMRRDAEMIAKDVATMSKNDLEMYKVGVARALYEEVIRKTHGSDKARAIISTPKKEKALEVIFGGKDKYQEFKRKLLAETEMHQTYSKTTGGSPTQPLQAEDQALRQNVGLVEDFLRGNRTDAMIRGGRMALERYRGVNDQARNNMAHILFEDDPAALRKYLQTLIQENSKAYQPGRGLLYQDALPYGSGVSGGLIGSNYSN